MTEPQVHQQTPTLWMRATSFIALRDLIGFIAGHSDGVRAADMEQWARRTLRVRNGKPPSRTTIYHYRNILLHLGVFQRQKGRYFINKENPAVSALLEALSPGSVTLSLEERRLFSELVIANEDCRRHFFNLFIPRDTTIYRLEDFISLGQRVAWKSHWASKSRRVHLRNLDEEKELWLGSDDEIQAILYGVRYWARNELGFLDEVFLEDLGGVMFPVELTDAAIAPQVAKALLKAIDDTQEWTTLSVRNMVFTWGLYHHISVERIFRTLLMIYRKHSEYIVLIPTAEAFATMTATSPGSERYQLRSYLHDFEGRYISHLRVHRKLKEMLQ